MPYDEYGNNGSSNPWMDVFSQVAGQYTNPRPADYYFKEDDPYYQAYLRKSQEAPQSESLIRDYLSRRPEEENYKPGIWRKMGGFLLGALSGNPTQAYKSAQQFTQDPYNDAMSEWTDEGKRIDTQARLSDAARTRELGAMKLGLDNRLKSLRYQSTDEGKMPGLGAKVASGVVGTDQRNRALDQGDRRIRETDEQNNWSRAFRQQQQDYAEQLKDAMLALADARFNHQVEKPTTTAHDQRANDPSEVLRQQEATKTLAGQAVINDLKGRNHPFLAKLQAFQAANPDGDWQDNIDQALEGIDPAQIRAFKAYISRIQRSVQSQYQQGQ
jgi:hypothetical protein